MLFEVSRVFMEKILGETDTHYLSFLSCSSSAKLKEQTSDTKHVLAELTTFRVKEKLCKFHFWLNYSFRTAPRSECQDDFGYSEEGKVCQGGPRSHKYKCPEMRSSNISAGIGLMGLDNFRLLSSLCFCHGQCGASGLACLCVDTPASIREPY